MNESVKNVKKFIKDRGNPYTLEDASKQLKNISSQTLAVASVKDKILKFHALSKEKFKSFQSAVYIKRDTLISATIHKFDLPPIFWLPLSLS